jgi:hypothetical protein
MEQLKYNINASIGYCHLQKLYKYRYMLRKKMPTPVTSTKS